MTTESPMYKMMENVLDGIEQKLVKGTLEYIEAEKVITRYIDLGARVDMRLVGKAHNILGIFALLGGDHKTALERFELAKDAFTMAGHSQGIAAAWNNMGEVYRKRGTYENALEAYEKACKTLESHDPTGSYLFAVCNTGLAHLELGNPLKAIELLENGLGLNDGQQLWSREVVQSLLVEVLSHLGKAYTVIGDYKRAKEYIERADFHARKLNDAQSHAYVYSAKIDLAIVENVESAQILELFDRCEAQWSDLGAKVEIARIRVRRADYLAVHGNIIDAIPFYKQAISIFEENDFNYLYERTNNKLNHVVSRVDQT